MQWKCPQQLAHGEQNTGLQNKELLCTNSFYRMYACIGREWNGVKPSASPFQPDLRSCSLLLGQEKFEHDN